MMPRVLVCSLLVVQVGLDACSLSLTSPTPISEAGDTFSGISVLMIRQSQGESRIEPSGNDFVSVQYNFTYPDSCHRAEITQHGDTLTVRGTFAPVACSGYADIHIWVPDGVRIEYYGSKADLVLDGIAVQIDAHGEKIRAHDLALTGDSRLFADDHGIDVSLAESPAYDLEISSHHGDVILHAAGHRLAGRIEFTVNEEHGMIRSPLPFDDETRYDCQCEPGVTWWLRKVINFGKELPHVKLSTRNGVAELRLKSAT